MKNLFAIALATLAVAQPAAGQQTTAGPLSQERWQRAILPPAGHVSVEQCVVLDAGLFADAAPGLRDVRLLQGSRELPYAVAESHDDRETGSTEPADDRSIFDTVGLAPLTVQQSKSPSMESSGVASLLLPARVPVERVTLRGTLNQPVSVVVRATPYLQPLGTPPGTFPDAEMVPLQAAPGHLSLPVTLGANLQHMADVEVTLTPAPPSVSEIVFEMRRRELCYKPLSAEPVHMIYGDPEAKLVHYDYALHYRPTPTPVLSQLGSRERNPAYLQPPLVQVFALTTKQRLRIVISLCVGMLAITLGAAFGLGQSTRKRR